MHARLNLPTDAQLVVNVGRTVAGKGQDELIGALPVLLERWPNLQLVIAGDGPRRPALTQVAAERGLGETVHLPGQINDVAALLHLADLFAFPSHHEGHPGALVEAMLAARPIAASAIPAHQEVLTDGVTGRLFPVQDVAGCAAAISQLLAAPEVAQQMGCRAQADAAQRFDIVNVAQQHEALYATLLGSR
jgi:glycosyltransferase involved in cell wall biosynthesis